MMTITTICSRVQNARETISGGRGQFQHHGQLVRGALPSNTAGKSEVSSNQEEHPPPQRFERYRNEEGEFRAY